MSWVFWLVIFIALGTVVSAILLLKQSATKFDLTEQQLKNIKARNETLDAQEKLDK